MIDLESLGAEYSIYGLIFTISNRLQTIGDSLVDDITMKQNFMMIVLSLQDNPPMLKEMADLIGCSYQNVKVMGEALKRNGYLTMEKDRTDNRKLILKSTGKLEKMGDNMKEAREEFMKDFYRGISEEDLKITLKTLLKMNENLGGKL